MIDFLASERQYFDHLEPVWRQLPAGKRGSFFVPEHLFGYAVTSGVTPSPPGPVGSVAVAASWGDLNGCHPSQRRVLMEHGVGQTYAGLEWNQRYAGAHGRESIDLFLSPNQRVYDLNTAATPGAQHVIIGSPRLDELVNIVDASQPLFDATVSFHFDTDFCDEITSAWAWIRPQLLQIGNSWCGHAHPRCWDKLSRWYDEAGKTSFPYFPLALAMGAVYVCDNSSTIYEAAAAGRPVVLLNAPQYRRHVNHGLRFWEFADVGVQVNHKNELGPAIELALEDPIEVAMRRAEIVDELFPHRGEAAYRASASILALL